MAPGRARGGAGGPGSSTLALPGECARTPVSDATNSNTRCHDCRSLRRSRFANTHAHVRGRAAATGLLQGHAAHATQTRDSGQEAQKEPFYYAAPSRSATNATFRGVTLRSHNALSSTE